MSMSIDEVLKQAHRAEARANALTDEIIAALNDALETLVSQITTLQVRYLTADTWEQERLQRKKLFLEAQRTEVERVIKEIYESKATAVVTATQDTMSHVESKMAGLPLANKAFIGLRTPHLDLPTITAWVESTAIEGLTMTEWLKRMAANTADKIVQAGREAMIRGLSVKQTATLLRQKGIEGSRPQIESIARTYLLSASNYAREQAIEHMGHDLDFQWLYLATLDGRTCPVCGADDGKVFKKGAKRPSLPRHINCRCTYAPIFEGTVEGTTRPATKHDSRTVHHRDGSTSTKFSVTEAEQVPATETYSQWIQRQLKEDPDFVRSVLGKTRFELFKKGQISLTKMVVDGRIKTLANL